MPSLRSLLNDIAPPTNRPQKVLWVWNENNPNLDDSPSANGVCCLWTVPAGTTSVTFELWGGGGAGGSGYCAWPMASGGGGSYARRTVETSAGCQYTICAAARSGRCCGNVTGPGGNTTFVSGSGISTTCALGGIGGYNCCYYTNHTTCTGPCFGAPNESCGDIAFPRTRNMVSNRGCYYRHSENATGAAIYGSSAGSVDSDCCRCRRGGPTRGQATFPGGGGYGGTACRCASCGSPGNGGLVKITYS